MTCIASRSRHGERHERDHPRPIDGRRDLALMLGAVPRQTPRHQLAAIGDEVLEQAGVLVIDLEGLVRAELAHLAPADRSLLAVAIAADCARTLAPDLFHLVGHGLVLPRAAGFVDAAEDGLFEVEGALLVLGEGRADVGLTG